MGFPLFVSLLTLLIHLPDCQSWLIPINKTTQPSSLTCHDHAITGVRRKKRRGQTPSEKGRGKPTRVSANQCGARQFRIPISSHVSAAVVTYSFVESSLFEMPSVGLSQEYVRLDEKKVEGYVCFCRSYECDTRRHVFPLSRVLLYCRLPSVCRTLQLNQPKPVMQLRLRVPHLFSLTFRPGWTSPLILGGRGTPVG
ncbi:hypothetical protein GE21DRAFT_1043145 [Neurospora crassa]|nr:hypothetical protein GE21DRAFT_1043145 [Neurospora crassa]